MYSKPYILCRAFIISVIFAADVKVTFDEYKKAMIGTATANTIITTNPGRYITIQPSVKMCACIV